MKTTIKKTEEIEKIHTNFGEISENQDKTWLTINNALFHVRLWHNKEKHVYTIFIDYTISRPCHDHNNQPHIELEIPEKGIIKCECGKHKETNAKLVIETDSGHLSLETFFKNYVWHKEARFSIPKRCWEGENDDGNRE